MGCLPSKSVDHADSKSSNSIAHTRESSSNSVAPVIVDYASLKALVTRFTAGSLVAQNKADPHPFRANYALHLEMSLSAMTQLIDRIDQSDESVDKSLLFQGLILILSQVRYHSLMYSHVLNRADSLKKNKFAPICSEVEFHAFRSVFFNTLPDTLSVLPAEVLGGPIAGNIDLEIDPKFHGFLRRKDQRKLSLVSKGLFSKTRAPSCERIYATLLSCEHHKAEKFLKKFPNWFRANADSLEASEAFFLGKFLSAIARGEQAYAERFLAIDPSLLLKSSRFTDYSGRTFHCTAYEYAYWAKDTHLCRMLEKYMDAEISSEMLKCIHDMERTDEVTGQPVGLTFYQNEQRYQSAHFDLTPLIQAFRDYIEGYEAWDKAEDFTAMEAAWLRVGLAQRDVPAHIAHEYCRRDQSFNPTPQFDQTTLPRLLRFHNYMSGRDEYYFPLEASGRGLGFDYALLRHNCLWPGATKRRRGFLSRETAMFDLKAIRRLEQVRTVDLIQSRRNLDGLTKICNNVERRQVG